MISFFSHLNMKETEKFDFFFRCNIDFYIRITCPCIPEALAGQLCTDA